MAFIRINSAPLVNTKHHHHVFLSPLSRFHSPRQSMESTLSLLALSKTLRSPSLFHLSKSTTSPPFTRLLARRVHPLAAVNFSNRASFGYLRPIRCISSGGGGGVGGGDGGGGGGDGEGGNSKGGGVVGAADDVAAVSSDVIILDVGGMTCGGCAASVKRILESQPQVSSASVNLATETAIVWPVSEAKVVANWQKELGEMLAKQLTSCGFQSNLRGQGDNDGVPL